MKRRFAVILSTAICLLMLFSAAACTDTAPETEIPDSVQTADPELRTAITTEGALDRFDVVYLYGNDEIENYIFWCEADITDFHIVALNFDWEQWTTNGIRLFEIPSLKANEAVNYKRMVPEGFPAEAVIYTVNGETYRYAVGYNGRDGGISLIEIDQLFVVADGGSDAVSTTSTTATTTTTKGETTTTAKTEFEGFMACIYWVSEDDSIFAREMTIESSSKWHIWRALKELNEAIPKKCSLISADMLAGRDHIMVLNFSEEFSDVASSMKGRLVLQAIANTYVETCDLNAVRFQIDGEYFESAGCGYAEEFGYVEQ